MAEYGVPYMGSKQKICDLICGYLPGAENFYDLFGGGFSITHCMRQRFGKKYKSFYFNEIQVDLVQLIKDAIDGKFNYEVFKPEWIDRATFEKNKAKCAYTRIIWSFGNNQKGYLFGKEIEADKKSLHNAVVFNNFDKNAIDILGITSFQPALSIKKKRLVVRHIVVDRLNKRGDLQQLERLQQLEQLQRLELTSLSYDKVEIKPNSIIYCDPPYINTASYLGTFDHTKFYEWVRAQNQPVFISEYTMPKDFDIAFSVEKKTCLSSKGMTSTKHEKLFVNNVGKELLLSRGLKTFQNK